MTWAMRIIFILIITVLLNGRKKIANLLPEKIWLQDSHQSLRQICVYLQ